MDLLLVVPTFTLLLIAGFVALWHPDHQYAKKFFDKFICPTTDRYLLANEEIEHFNNFKKMCGSHVFKTKSEIMPSQIQA